MPDDIAGGVEKGGPMVGDLAGVGQLINSEVAKRTYDDALSPVMKEIGGLSQDVVKSCRLFLAPFQYAAAWQERFKAFCDRVRSKVPEEEQCDAPPEIARPVIEALSSTSDDSPLMGMFEELMAKAIDKRETKKLSPEFATLIKTLSPLEALLVTDLRRRDQYTDDLFNRQNAQIMGRVGANFDFDSFGGQEHHLTIGQSLAEKKIIAIMQDQPVDATKLYPNLVIPPGLSLTRTVLRLTMYGRWFAAACTERQRP